MKKQDKPAPAKQPPAKMPKARVMYAAGSVRNRLCVLNDMHPGFNPCAVIPCRTRKQAAALVKWHSLTREEKVERIAAYIKEHNPAVKYPAHIQAAAILNLTEPNV